MSTINLIDELIEKKKGIICTSDIVAAGISKPYFAEYAKKNSLERVSHGVYVAKDAWADSMYLLQLRFGKAIFSHETALYLHNLTDQEPLELTVTVPSGYNTTKLRELAIKAYTIKNDLHQLGLMELTNPFGNPVKVYNMERTVCDILRSRSKVEVQTFQDALKNYTKRKDKDLHRLMQYAATLHVEKILRKYLEVLL